MSGDPDTCPPDVRASLDRYANDGVPTGGFLTAVLENDLKGAVGRADSHNALCLRGILGYVIWELDGRCHGSPEIVSSWLALHRDRKARGEE